MWVVVVVLRRHIDGLAELRGESSDRLDWRPQEASSGELGKLDILMWKPYHG